MLEKALIDYFQNMPYVVSVTLFGFFARNTATDKSDVDIYCAHSSCVNLEDNQGIPSSMHRI